MTNPKNNDTRGKRKKVSPASASGGKGPSFENRVQAQRLLAMCLAQKSCPGIPTGYRIVHLRFQARVHEYNTDDLICTLENEYGHRAQVLMQMKRTLAPGSPSFEEAVGLAWLDFSTGVLRRKRDRIVMVYDVGSIVAMQGAADLAKIAQTSTSAASFHLKATAPNASNQKKRKALDEIQEAVDLYAKTSVPLEDLFLFLQHVDFLHQDLDRDSTESVANCLQQIGFATSVARLPPPSDAVWSKLVTTCMDLNGVAGEVDLSTVAMHIGTDLDYRFTTFRQHQSVGFFQPMSAHVVEPSTSGFGVVDVRIVPAPQVALQSQGQVGDLVPAAREASAKKYISRRLDQLAAAIKECRYGVVLCDLEDLGQDLAALDEHQKARWYLMRGTCVWHLHGHATQAADDYLKAADLCSDEDKLVAARIRGHLLKENIPAALEAGRSACERFPTSQVVWASFTNARVVNGESVGLNDIPVEHREEAVAYQIVANASSRVGDFKRAFEIAMLGLEKNDATFFTREAALRYGLDFAQQNPLRIAFRMQESSLQVGLRKVADSFSPRETQLWSVQSTQTVSAATTHLAYVYLLLGEPEQTLKLVQEAADRNIDTEGTILRPHMDALRDLGREQEALALGLPHVSTMALEALVGFAQLAADQLDQSALDAVVEQVRARADLAERRSELLTTLHVLRWDMLLRTGNDAQVREEAEKELVVLGDSFETNLVSARAFLRGSDAAKSKQYVDRVRTLTQNEEKPGAKYLFSRLLLEAKEYRDAAETLVDVLPEGAFSEPHVDLLFCYVRTGQRARARELIRSFPADWSSNSNARHLVMELGQMAGDWDLLASLVGPQMQHQPAAAMTWLFSLMVATRESHEAMLEVLRNVPPILEGPVKEISQIASAELRSGFAEAGLRRLYRLRRSNLGNGEAAAAHFTVLVTAPDGLPNPDPELSVVVAGSSVFIVNDNGEGVWRTIDPVEMTDLPPTEEFLRYDSKEAAVLMGLRKGEVIVNRAAFGTETKLVVAEITSAHRRLFTLSNEAIRNPLFPNASVVHLGLPKDDQGKIQLRPLVRQFEEKVARADKMLGLYEASGLTLGGLGRLVGKSEFDFVRGWVQEGPMLFVGGGTVPEREAALKAIAEARSVVVDITALTELALVGQLKLLATLPRVMVTAATKDVVERRIFEQENLPAEGQAVLHEGQVGFARMTESGRAAELSFLVSIRDAIQNHTEGIPAYGPVEVDPLLEQLSKVLSAQEFSAVMAALEHNALLLTLDGRLRSFAGGVGVVGAWPQALLIANRGTGLAESEYSIAIVRMFLGRRDFISVNASDLILVATQGGGLFNAVVNRLRTHLSEPQVEFASAASVVLEFLYRIYARGNTQFGVVMELFGYLLEPLLRHKDCPPGYAEDATVLLYRKLGPSAAEPRYNETLEIFAKQAVDRSKRPLKRVSIRATVLFGTWQPTFMNGLTDSSDPTDDVTGQQSSNQGPLPPA